MSECTLSERMVSEAALEKWPFLSFLVDDINRAVKLKSEKAVNRALSKACKDALEGMDLLEQYEQKKNPATVINQN